MGLKPFFIVLAVFFITVLIWKNPAHSETSKIEKLDKAGLEALLSKADGRCMIVAMAAWCSPCRKELPVLVELYNRYKSKGLKIVGISLDLEGPRAMQPIIDKAKVNFPVYWVGEDPIEDFDIYAIPMLFIVKEGKVVEKIPGKRSKKYLEDKIRQLIGE